MSNPFEFEVEVDSEGEDESNPFAQAADSNPFVGQEEEGEVEEEAEAEIARMLEEEMGKEEREREEEEWRRREEERERQREAEREEERARQAKLEEARREEEARKEREKEELERMREKQKQDEEERTRQEEEKKSDTRRKQQQQQQASKKKDRSPPSRLMAAPASPVVAAHKKKKSDKKRDKKSESKKPSKSPRLTSSEGKVELGLAKSTNKATKGLLVWGARKTIGLPVLVVYKKRVSMQEWQTARFRLFRKKTGALLDPDADKVAQGWRDTDRRRLVLAGSKCAVFELVLAAPTRSGDVFYPVYLSVEVAGTELVSKSFFVLEGDALTNLTKKALRHVEDWFMNPDMALSSVVQSRFVRSNSLAQAFLKKHQAGAAAASLASSPNQGSALFSGAGGVHGVVAKFARESPIMRCIEEVYPVPVPMDSIALVISISQVFHFTHESIQWVGDLPEGERDAFSQMLMPAGMEWDRDKLHVYGQILPYKGMYQHSNPRLKRPYEVLCGVLKVILACNGLPQSWLEEDGAVPAETDLVRRKFASYEEVFRDATVFNVNEALEVLARSVRISKSGALVVDYSVVVPVLVNSLSALHGHFARLRSSRLKDMLGEALNELFAVQLTVQELGEELRVDLEQKDTKLDAGMLAMREFVRARYRDDKMHLTQGADRDLYVAPSFDLFESTKEMRTFMASDTLLEYDELAKSDLNVFRLVIRGASGAGKTTLCKHMAREWAREQDALFQGKFPLVLFISLDALTTATYADLEEVRLEDVVYREVVRHNKGVRAALPEPTAIREWLMRNYSRILWIFDGIEALEQHLDNEKSSRNVERIYDALRANAEPAVKHKVITVTTGSRAKVHADLYLLVRLFEEHQVDAYVRKFIGGARAAHVLQWMRKTHVMARDYVRVPLNLELVCACHVADPAFNVSFEQPLSLFFDRLFGWLMDSSAEEFSEERERAAMQGYVLRLAWQSYFKSKFRAPTVTKRLLNQIPRDMRARVSNTMFFEHINNGKGVRFLHPRMQEFMVAKHMACAPLTEEILARLRSKLVAVAFHGVFYFLVGLLRDNTTKLQKLMDVVLLDAHALHVLGSAGVTFVFRCFEEANFERAVRKSVIAWFWRNFGQPTMQVWRNTHVVNLLELIIFKLAARSGSTDIKAKAVDALGQLGVDSERVVALLVRSASAFPDLVPCVVRAVRQLTLSDRNVIPVLIAGLEQDKDLQCVVHAVEELRRVVVDEGQVRQEALARLLELSEQHGKDKEVTRAILDTLSHWRVSDDACVPLLVRALQLWDVDIRRSAIAAVQFVELTGPNVLYSERVFSLLEEIASSTPELRVEVLRAFLQLGMESRFVLATMVDCVQEAVLPAIELCGEFHLLNPLVIQAIVTLVQTSDDQQARRLAVDMLAYMHLPRYQAGQHQESDRIQEDVNQVIDVFYGMGLNSKFILTRVQRMAEKKRKSAHITFEEFGAKYLRGK